MLYYIIWLKQITFHSFVQMPHEATVDHGSAWGGVAAMGGGIRGNDYADLVSPSQAKKQTAQETGLPHPFAEAPCKVRQTSGLYCFLLVFFSKIQLISIFIFHFCFRHINVFLFSSC